MISKNVIWKGKFIYRGIIIIALKVLQSAEILLLGHPPRHGVCLLSLLLVPGQASAKDTGGW